MNEAKLLKMGFVKFIPKKDYHRYSLYSEFYNLKIGESLYTSEHYNNKMYSCFYQQKKRSGKEFSFMKIKNGTIITRIK